MKRTQKLKRKALLFDLLRSDVVVTNGHNTALGLWYNASELPAPVVTFFTDNPKEALFAQFSASFHNIPRQSNPALISKIIKAKAKSGDYVPETAYRDVAKVIAYAQEIDERKVGIIEEVPPKDEDEEIPELDEETEYIMEHRHEKERLLIPARVDLEYVLDVLDLLYDYKTLDQPRREIPEEDAWIPEALGLPSVDSDEEAKFVLEGIGKDPSVDLSRKQKLTPELASAIVDLQHAFLVEKGIGFYCE
jgi:type III secretion system FlhB-like substrate exporter